jgi:hypothetical protein
VDTDSNLAAKLVAFSFPQDWAPHCPPTDATDAAGTYYRRILTAPPEAKDFRSYVEMERKIPIAKTCEARGLSVFVLLEDAKAYAERYPDNGGIIAKANLDYTDGKIKSSPRNGNSHATWWPYDEVKRHIKFVVLP